MAVETSGGHPAMDYAEHVRTYQRFIRWTIGMIVFVVLILVFLADASFRSTRFGRCVPTAEAAPCPVRHRGEALMVTIAVTAERDDEPRVAISPETVKKLGALGATVRVQAGAGKGSRFSDDLLKAQGAVIAASAAEALAGADILLKVRRPSRRRGQGAQARRHRRRHAGSLRRPAGSRCAGRHRRVADGHGVHAAHLARAVHGRAVEPGQPRRLQGRGRCGRHVPAGDADDDDGGGHGAGGQGLHHGRRRRRPAGDRHRAPARRHRHGHRRAPRHQGAGGLAGRQVHRGRGRGVQAGADRGRLRQADVGGVPEEAGRAGRQPHQDPGHRHHHGADPRPAGAQADLHGHDREHEARLP